MSRPDSEKGKAVAKAEVLSQAQYIAELSDRWFISAASGLAQLGTLAKRGAEAATEAVTSSNKRLESEQARAVKSAAASPRPKSPPQSAGRAQKSKPALSRNRAASDSDADEFATTGTEHSQASDNAKPRLEVLEAVRRAPRGDAAFELRNKDNHPGNPPGVLPVLEALRNVANEHAKSGGGSLHDDERFWALVHLLKCLTQRRSELPVFARDGEIAKPQFAASELAADVPSSPGDSRADDEILAQG